MTNRFKGLDVVDRVLEELWTEFHNIVQEAMTGGSLLFSESVGLLLLNHLCLIHCTIK